MLRFKLLVPAALLSFAGAATADVRISVPANLLGGRVAPAKPLPPSPPAPSDPAPPPGFDDNAVDIDDPDFWDLVWPSEAGGIAQSDSIACDEDLEPGSCGVFDDAAADLVPEGAVTQSVGATPDQNLAPARRLHPGLGTWMQSQTPTLRWDAEPGASFYNLQIYLGPRRVASVWTTRTQVKLPPRLINQGRYYMWAVWPASGPRSKPIFRQPIGRSVFGVVLRPRIVFRAAGKARVVGEVRPRIPGGVLALHGRGVSIRVRIGADSRIRLSIGRARAERIAARLLDPGPTPPKGLVRP